MHGEYKVPGGKLVVVDLDVEAGRLANVRLAGDFFLEPDDALGAINAAVSGLPSEADVPTIAAAVRAALPDGAQLLGFTPEAVGTVVRRALVTASGWKDFSWQIVHDRPVSPRMNLALDEVLTTRVGDGRRMPTLRLWEWNESAVVIGSRRVPAVMATTSSGESRAAARCSWAPMRSSRTRSRFPRRWWRA